MLKEAPPSSGIRALQARLLAEEEAVPTAAARYYLTETDGDVRAAKAMHRAPPSSESPPVTPLHTPPAPVDQLPRPASPHGTRTRAATRRAWWRLCLCGGSGHE